MPIILDASNSGTMTSLGSRNIYRAPSGVLYSVVFRPDAGDGKPKIAVVRFDGTNWAIQDDANGPLRWGTALKPWATGAIDSNGILHLVESGGPTVAGHYYNQFNTNTNAWVLKDQTIHTGNTNITASQYNVALALDSNNAPHFVYVDTFSSMGSAYDGVYYRQRTSGAWSAAVAVQATTAGAGVPVITFDNNGRPMVAFADGAGNLRLGVGNATAATSFTLTNVGTTGGNRRPSIAVDTAGNRVIAYQSGTGYTVDVNGTKYSQGLTTSWISVAPVGADIHLFIGNSDLRHVKLTNGALSTATVLSSVPPRMLQSGWARYVNYGSNGTNYPTSAANKPEIDLIYSDDTDIHSYTFSTAVATAPTVTTSAATSIGQTGATGNGNVTADGGATITERGFVWSTTASPTVANSKVTVAGTTGVYSGALSGLTAGTTYYYRAYAINSAGTSYGADASFTTTSALAAPSVTSEPVSNVTQTSAQANANVTSDNGATITERGIVWATTANPTVSNNKIVVAGTTGAYNASITGLTHSTGYNYRGYAINSQGTSYGGNIAFTTASPTPPTLGDTTLVANKAMSITASGNITSTGDATVTTRGFVYLAGTTGDPTLANSVASESGTFSTGVYNMDVTGLTGNTAYRVRAYATSSAGTSYGTTIQITTKRSIYYLEDLKNMINVVSGGAIVGDWYLVRDLDFNDDASYSDPATNKPTWTTGLGWIALGRGSASSEPWFAANFDGGGHTISNLMCNANTTGETNTGLFGVIDAPTTNGFMTIENLGLVNPRINANATNTAFVQCGALTLGIDPYGGVTIKNCYAKGGRVVGGTGSGNNGVGALIGIAHEYPSPSKVRIENCYADGTVVYRNGTNPSADAGAGGLIGTINTSSAAATGYIFMEVTNCYSNASVGGQSTSVQGGLIGVISTSASPNTTVTSSYWDTQTSGKSTSAAGTGKTTAEMKTMSTYTGWSIASFNAHTTQTWYINEGIDYPRLYYEAKTVALGGLKKVLLNGTWTAKPVKFLVNAIWTTKPAKTFNGSSWTSSVDN